MLDNERNKNTSYSIRINNEDPLACVVIVYPQVDSNPSSTITGTFRYDAMPKWMTDSMKTLDAAATDGEADIPDFGAVYRGAYWFMAEQTNPERNKSKKD